MLAFMTRLVLLALVVTGASSALAGEVVQVVISKLAFVPAEVSIRAGDIVRWTNHDFVPHTATAMPGPGGVTMDVTIPPGGSVEWLATSATGPVPYFCRFHPNMKGVIKLMTE